MEKNSFNGLLHDKIIKNAELIDLKKMHAIFDRELKINFFSKIVSLVLIIGSFILEFPTGGTQWLFKFVEIAMIVLAVYTFTLAIKTGLRTRQAAKDKVFLEIQSKKQNMSVERYINRHIQTLLDSILSWAKFHKIKIRHTRHNHLRHVIDFFDFPIDYIDINIINSKLVFGIRISDLNLISKIAEDLPRSCNELSLVIDKYHIGSKESLTIDEDGVHKGKDLIINVVLSKVYNTVYF